MSVAEPLAPGAVVVRAPAKINLALRVGDPRPDGYHPVLTIYHAISLRDEIRAEAGEPGGGISLSLDRAGERAGVPLGEDNLAVRAVHLLAEQFGCPPDVVLTLHKAIPVAAGLAGGSADAAAALIAAAAVLGCTVSGEQMRDLAAGIGSDVPFALVGGTSLGTGRGELLTPVLARGTLHWVLGCSRMGLSTPTVYGTLDRLRASAAVPPADLSPPTELLTALAAGDPAGVGAHLTNDLQAPALTLRPELATLLDAGLQAGALGAVVSGSGPTCAFLAASEAHSIDLAVALSSVGVCETVLRAHGPVSGPLHGI